MKYLLDTHALIWAITDLTKLSKIVKRELENGENEIFISSVTYWEIAVKYSIKKINIAGFNPQQLPEISIQLGFVPIPLTPYETSTSHFLKGDFHKDPFDRILIWQAISQNLTLITKDEEIMKYQSFGLKVLW